MTLYSCTVLHCTFNVYLDFCEYVCLCVNVCVCFLYNVYVFAHLYRIYQLHFAGECLMCIVAVTTYRADTLDLASVSFQPAMRIVTMVPLLFLPKKYSKSLSSPFLFLPNNLQSHRHLQSYTILQELILHITRNNQHHHYLLGDGGNGCPFL